MNCCECKTEIKKAKFNCNIATFEASNSIEIKNKFGTAYNSKVECYVCLNCGKVSFKAVNLKESVETKKYSYRRKIAKVGNG